MDCCSLHCAASCWEPVLGRRPRLGAGAVPPLLTVPLYCTQTAVYHTQLISSGSDHLKGQFPHHPPDFPPPDRNAAPPPGSTSSSTSRLPGHPRPVVDLQDPVAAAAVWPDSPREGWRYYSQWSPSGRCQSTDTDTQSRDPAHGQARKQAQTLGTKTCSDVQSAAE